MEAMVIRGAGIKYFLLMQAAAIAVPVYGDGHHKDISIGDTILAIAEQILEKILVIKILTLILGTMWELQKTVLTL